MLPFLVIFLICLSQCTSIPEGIYQIPLKGENGETIITLSVNKRLGDFISQRKNKSKFDSTDFSSHSSEDVLSATFNDILREEREMGKAKWRRNEESDHEETSDKIGEAWNEMNDIPPNTEMNVIAALEVFVKWVEDHQNINFTNQYFWTDEDKASIPKDMNILQPFLRIMTFFTIPSLNNILSECVDDIIKNL